MMKLRGTYVTYRISLCKQWRLVSSWMSWGPVLKDFYNLWQNHMQGIKMRHVNLWSKFALPLRIFFPKCDLFSLLKVWDHKTASV